MEEKKEQVLFFIIIIGIIFVFVFFAILGLSISNYSYDIKECKNYESYGYVVEKKSLYEYLGYQDNACLIIMEDNTKLPLDVFKKSLKTEKVIVEIKKPKIRGE